MPVKYQIDMSQKQDVESFTDFIILLNNQRRKTIAFEKGSASIIKLISILQLVGKLRLINWS